MDTPSRRPAQSSEAPSKLVRSVGGQDVAGAKAERASNERKKANGGVKEMQEPVEPETGREPGKLPFSTQKRPASGDAAATPQKKAKTGSATSVQSERTAKAPAIKDGQAVPKGKSKTMGSDGSDAGARRLTFKFHHKDPSKPDGKTNTNTLFFYSSMRHWGGPCGS
ncbi:hypothetical protein B0A55_04013 [Friedmanniomyces simplex]|uniref:Uncharacterized protein n=1 Tax=Friedmanniomyces simplex TaxID=329884 RepID=A0A4U0XKE1_9PEZI|nr:hypothetical protein B0A55_04013 [Friedmanniomyces simplex]